VIVNPKPVQHPLPPVYMATSSLDGVEVGARLGINMFLPIHTRAPEQVVEYAQAYWDGLKKNGHEPKSRELGLLIPMHLAATTAEAKSRAEAGVMSLFQDDPRPALGLHRLADATRRRAAVALAHCGGNDGRVRHGL